MRGVTSRIFTGVKAGNAVYTLTNDTMGALDICSGEIVYTASTAVANRVLRLALYDDAGVSFEDTHAGIAVTAGQTMLFDIMQGNYREGAAVNGSVQMPIPLKLTVPEGWSLRVEVDNADAADFYTGFFMTSKTNGNQPSAARASVKPSTIAEWDFRTGSLAAVTGSGTFVCTRASQKWVRNAAGLLELIAVNAAPFNYSSVDGVRRLLVEEAATQLLVAASSRDLTNVNWAKVNGTAAKDQVGADGVAAAASSFTATAPNATCLQTVVAAATNRVFSMRVRRITGTGAVTISGDNFSTSTDITALINGTTFTRVFLNPASVLNPIVGLKLATSGDAVAVDFVNLVAATQLTSDLDSTVSSRAADVVVLNPFTMPSPATIVVRGMMQAIDGTLDGTVRFMFTISDGTVNELVRVQRTASAQTMAPVVVDGGVSQLSGIGRPVGPNVRVASATAIATNDVAGSTNALATQTDATVTLPTVNRIHIGSNHAASGSWWNAGIESLRIDNVRKPNETLQGLAT